MTTRAHLLLQPWRVAKFVLEREAKTTFLNHHPSVLPTMRLGSVSQE